MKTEIKLTLVGALLLMLFAGQSVWAQDNSEDEVDSGEMVLEEILVTADRVDSFSSDYVQVGTFRNARQLDTPLTVSVITEEMLKSQLASTVLDALRNTSGVTTAAISSTVYNNLSIRGIPIENRGNWRLNGALPIVNLVALPMENKSRLEALKGASALYYGFSTPSGIVNLVTKRPTGANAINDFRIFGNFHGTFGGHLDISRGTDQFGVRVNVMTSTLDNGVDVTSGDRSFASLALDWHPNENLSFYFDAEYVEKDIVEPTTYRAIDYKSANPTLPELLDQSHNLASKWFTSPAQETNILGRVTYKLSDAWQLSADAGVSDMERDRVFSMMLFDVDPAVPGDGREYIEQTNNNTYKNTFYRAELAGAFATGSLKHELVLGVSSNTRDSMSPFGTWDPFPQNYYDPIRVPVNVFKDSIPRVTGTTTDIGLYAFDRITFNDKLQMTLGVRNNDYKDEALKGGVTTVYKTNPTTFSASVGYKFTDRVNTYASYIEGLENARIAPSYTVNAGDSLPAALSEQWEIGVKAQITPGFLATVAYFDIERESSFVNSDDYFVLDGLANYKGVEFSLSGEITSGLSIYASGLFLDAKQVSGTPALVGNDIENAPDFSGSVFLEYQPEKLEGLKISGGVFNVGKRAGINTNTYYAPGYTTFDLGASYSTNAFFSSYTTFSLYWENVTDKKYWAAASGKLLAPGLPPTIRFSVAMSF